MTADRAANPIEPLQIGLAWLDPLFARLGFDALQQAEWLPWLVLFAAAILWFSWRARPRAISWPGMSEARAAGARRFDPMRALGLGLRATALACLATVLAGPVAIHRAPPEPGLGLDLILAVDTSGSMRALDASMAAEARTRLDLARSVVARFADRRVSEGDRVGLVVFGNTAFTQCPLTSDGALLRAALDRISVGMAGEATALGDALALAVKRTTGTTPAGASDAGRVIVLLTDGRSNAGAVPIEVASRLATSAGIRVHTVGIGSGGEKVPMEARAGAARRGLRFERHDPDLDTLRRIADASGGRFFAARRSGDLDAVYREIDSLERTPRPLPPRVRLRVRAEPLLAIAGVLLFVEIGFTRVVRRTLS